MEMPIAPRLLGLLAFGFLLGLQHALDPDHVVAVSTLVSETKSLRRSSLLGALWGLGHTTTLLLAGLVVLLLKVAIPERVALSFEFLVGILLVILGGDVVRRVWQERPHVHLHTHADGTTHIHLHSHRHGPDHHHGHRSYMVGLVHGLAGSAALLLLVLGTVEQLSLGILFILVFGLGSILGMLVTSTAIALPFTLLGRMARVDRSLRLAAGTISILLGVAIMVEIGWFEGLLRPP